MTRITIIAGLFFIALPIALITGALAGALGAAQGVMIAILEKIDHE